MLNLIKAIIGLILYVPALVIGLLIASFKIAKEEGILDEMQAPKVTDGLIEGVKVIRDFQNEVKKI